MLSRCRKELPVSMLRAMRAPSSERVKSPGLRPKGAQACA